MSTSITSPRAMFALIIPSTNTTVEAEFNWMRVPGISWHSGRIWIPNPMLNDDATTVAFLENLRTEIGTAVKNVMTAMPTYLVMGMSAETFWGGKSGATEFKTWMETLSGLDVTTGANACKAALDIYGAKRIGIITPYQEVTDLQVVDFFTEMGYVVVNIKGLRCESASAISAVSHEKVKATFREVDGPDVDLLIQAGTNMVCVLAAAEMEIELGKPVIAINTATVWHAYRTNGIKDQIKGFGSLLEKH